jgi:CTP:molybdopterin cytidylyltransferase MocA
MDGSATAGLVLAAGAGTRYGMPKALVRSADGTPWVARAVDALRAGGCGTVLVALGAAADEAAALVPAGARIVRVADWADGLSATLRAGLAAAADTPAVQLVVVPVDTPGLPATVVRRIVEEGRPLGPEALVRATYAGDPGHPVLLGRAHWSPLAAAVSGDRGAGRYLVERGVREVDCVDYWPGTDIDSPVADS